MKLEFLPGIFVRFRDLSPWLPWRQRRSSESKTRYKVVLKAFLNNDADGSSALDFAELKNMWHRQYGLDVCSLRQVNEKETVAWLPECSIDTTLLLRVVV